MFLFHGQFVSALSSLCLLSLCSFAFSATRNPQVITAIWALVSLFALLGIFLSDDLKLLFPNDPHVWFCLSQPQWGTSWNQLDYDPIFFQLVGAAALAMVISNASVYFSANSGIVSSSLVLLFFLWSRVLSAVYLLRAQISMALARRANTSSSAPATPWSRSLYRPALCF